MIAQSEWKAITFRSRHHAKEGASCRVSSLVIILFSHVDEHSR
jgi:hypothetical protein